MNRPITPPDSPKHAAKASVIDLGSNSVKMVNYNLGKHDSYKPYHQESARVKLAEGLVDGAMLESHIEKTLETLKLFRSIIDFEQINHVVAVATSAVRDASNRAHFLERIRAETGFDFNVLSEREEALYSYAGAIGSLNLPSVVFFDIGGGSLELVSSTDFEIQHVASLPLGSLRLTRQFSTDGEFTKSGISRMKSHIAGQLPDRESLGISGTDHVLVGVGGTLRALAKYDQQKSRYPLEKLHNYSMPYESLELLSQHLLARTAQEISRVESMGNGRSCTVQAGSLVILELARKLGFRSVLVSAQGLREGTLSLSLQHPEEFAAHTIDAGHVQEMIRIACRPACMSGHVEEMVQLMRQMDLITDRERILLGHATSQIDRLSSFRDVNNALYTILDDDSILSHREQLIVALSLIYSKKRKKADSLFARFEGILRQQDRKSIKKISSVVSVCDIFHKTGTAVRPSPDGTGTISLNVYTAKNMFPEVLLRQACARMEAVMGIQIRPEIYYTPSGPAQSGPIGAS